MQIRDDKHLQPRDEISDPQEARPIEKGESWCSQRGFPKGAWSPTLHVCIEVN